MPPPSATLSEAGAARTVVVTGANGFIGRLLVPSLVARGYRVRAVSRQADDARLRTPVEPTASAWSAIVTDADAVVHLAAIAHQPPPGRAGRRQLRAVNVQMPEALARAAATAGVSTFVFVSSIKAVAGKPRSEAIDETDSPRPADCYGLAKLAAERRLDRVARQTGMRIVILRPPLVFGPGVKANFLRLMQLARWSARGLPLPLAQITNRRSLLYAGNLVSAIARVLDCRGRGPGEATPIDGAAADTSGARRYHVADEPALSTAELVDRLARASGGRARLFPLPAGWIDAAARLLGRDGLVERLTGSLVVDGGRFRHDFEWTSETPLEEGLALTMTAPRQRSASGSRVRGETDSHRGGAG